MKKWLVCLLAAILLPTVVSAKEWDEKQYKQIEQSIRVPQFSDATFVITKYGAKPSATAEKNQKAIQKAIDKCAKKGGGRVVVPAGQTFLTGAIELKSHVNLVVEEGATLLFAFQPELYPIVPTRWEGLDCWNLSPCIFAYKATDVAITGKGTIDGNGSNDTWWPWCGKDTYGWREGVITQKTAGRPRLLKAAEDGVPMDERRFEMKDGLRPQLICLNKCEGILIEDVTLLRSPFWVIHPLLSNDVTVRGVKIINDGPNGDGCDPESCNRVMIENCFFNTGDDCIAIKSGRNNDGRLWNIPSQNIIIRNCEMKNGHGGVVIGSEISGGCRNVYAHDNVMDSPELERVIRIKTNPCRGGVIENINARNIKVGVCKESVLKINLDYEPNELCCRGYLPTVRNVNIENITCERSQYGVQIIAFDTICNVYDINVKNCRFNGVKSGNSIKGQTRDVRFDNLFINGSLSLLEKPYKNYSEWMTRSEMKRTPKSYMLDFSTRPKWSYVMGIELESMLDTYLRYGGEDIRQYCQEYTDTMINQKGDIRGYQLKDYNLDNIRTGHFVARMYQLWPEAKNLIAMQTMMKQLQDQPRTKADQVYWHKAIYAYQVWLDGIFMGLPYRCLTAPITEMKGKGKNMRPDAARIKAIYDDAVNQLKVTYERTLDPKTGLNRHAYDETRNTFWADKETGLSQHCWGRAQGWYTMALIEVLDALPEDYSRRGEVIELLKKDFDAILKWQDKKSGVWYQVMDAPGREGNYLESTCSAMFTYALLKAYRKGYVGVKYRDAGIKAYRGIISNFIRVNEDKTISLTNCCSVAGLGPAATEEVIAAMKQVNPKGSVKENKRRDGSYNYYLSEKVRDNDAKGLGPFIWASLEMEQMGFNTENIDQPIDRKAVVSRNNPIIREANPLASLSVGNGHFATTVDVTGLQSYPFDYEAGVPLTAMSDWGWHKFENTNRLVPSETERTMDLGHGHKEAYAVEYKAVQNGVTERNVEATKYFRVNPHRLNLGTIGLSLSDKSGQPVPLKALTNINQELKLFNGTIESSFQADGEKVEVMTACLQDRAATIYRIKSNLLKDQRAKVSIRFSYPSGKHSDDGNDWTKPEKHESKIIAQDDHNALIERTLDDTRYYLLLKWQEDAAINLCDRHHFEISTTGDVLAIEAEYIDGNEQTARKKFDGENLVFDQELRRVFKAVNTWWREGAIVDFSQCTDPRAKELERRVVLSQYLTHINCDGNMPPQETGLTYNSWFGRPHLEMTWWHLVDFALWNRPETTTRMLAWYNDVAYPVAKQIAERQGFKGIRWMKMTDPQAGEAPSNTGSFLIWQQPHYIYLAEEAYRANPSVETLKAYAKQVEETAVFMADFVSMGSGLAAASKLYHLQGATAMQESMSKDFSYDHPFELAYWRYGLDIAQQWRERQGLPRHEAWDNIISNLAPLPQNADGILTAGRPLYPFNKNAKSTQFDPYNTATHVSGKEISEADFLEKSHNDHPAVIAPYALLPLTTYGDLTNARKALAWVFDNWNWATTWGWDYGMLAMAAARLGEPQKALDALLIDTQKNTYLPSGHNYQDGRLRLYLPGNGALLTAVAMMCAGWDGSATPFNPGFPQDGKWDVRWENLQRMQ